MFSNFRPETISSGSAALVFTNRVGEKSITTRDLALSTASVIQFDVSGYGPRGFNSLQFG